MPTARCHGIDLEYTTDGDPADLPLLLVAGLGQQLIGWPQGLVERLCARGVFLVRFDNRDSGLSTKFQGTPDLGALLGGDPSSAAYLVEDMADDAATLLDVLGIRSAHVAGVSMGGMITQALVIRHPDHVNSACSIMSTTGDRAVGAPTDAAITALLRPPGTDRAEAIANAVEISRVIGSPRYPEDQEILQQRAAAAFDRCYCPDGTVRQLAAVLASADRSNGLRGVRVPFLAIHGEDDPLIACSGGVATAAAVPGAQLRTFPGMGHDLPRELWDDLVDALLDNMTRAGR